MVKKIPSPAVTPKHERNVPARTHTGNGARGAGVRGFSRPARAVFSYSMLGGFFPPQAEFLNEETSDAA